MPVVRYVMNGEKHICKKCGKTIKPHAPHYQEWDDSSTCYCYNCVNVVYPAQYGETTSSEYIPLRKAKKEVKKKQ